MHGAKSFLSTKHQHARSHTGIQTQARTNIWPQMQVHPKTTRYTENEQTRKIHEAQNSDTRQTHRQISNTFRTSPDLLATFRAHMVMDSGRKSSMLPGTSFRRLRTILSSCSCEYGSNSRTSTVPVPTCTTTSTQAVTSSPRTAGKGRRPPTFALIFDERELVHQIDQVCNSCEMSTLC